MHSSTAPPLSILLIEDSDDDALLVTTHAQVANRDVRVHRVQTEQELRVALAENRWDAVLSDYALPGYSGLSALQLVRQCDPDLPFLIVSGVIGEEAAVEVMRAGAQDYIMKKSLVRLAPALERELDDAAKRRTRRRDDAAREQQLSKQIQKSTERIARLQAVTAELATAKTPRDVATAVVNHGAAMLGARAGCVAVLAEDRASLRSLYVMGYAPEAGDSYREIPLGADLPLAAVVRTGEAVWLRSHEVWNLKDPAASATYQQNGSSAAILPLLIHGRAVGGLEFIFEQDWGFAEDDRAFVVDLAQQCAHALDRATFYAAAPQIETRFQLQANLIDTVWQAVVATTAEGVITYWNHGADRLFGYPAEEVLGRNIVDVLPTTQPEDASPGVHGMIATDGEMISEHLIRLRDGTVAPVLTQRMLIRNELGTITGIIGVSNDISKLKHAEHQLRWSEERFRRLVDDMHVGIIVQAPSAQILTSNPAAREILGLTAEQLMGMTSFDPYWNVIHEDGTPFPADTHPQIEALATQKPVRTVTMGIWRPTRGDRVWILVDAVPHIASDGTVSQVISTFVDITPRREAEQALISSEQRYRALVETSPDGILLNDTGGIIVMANRQLAFMLGYESPSDLTGVNIETHLFDFGQRPTLEQRQQRGESKSPVSTNSRCSVRRRDGSVFPAEIISLAAPQLSGETGYITSTIHDVTDRVAYEAQLHQLALHDPMTGLANRTLLYDRLQQTLARARRNSESVAVLLLDLDRFKDINDTFGHQVGDETIREVAARLASVLRKSDTLARMGGDEFVILLPETDVQGARQTAEKLGHALERPIDLGDQRLRVGPSIGIALFPDHAEDPDTILRHADVAMYTAKQANDDYAIYSIEKDSYSPIRLTLSGELRDAIQSNELVLHYHPKMRLATGEIDGMEALVRWKHPTHGLILPDQFIPLAEHTGLIRPLTTWVLDNALSQCRKWWDLGFSIGIAVNLSARSLHDPDLPRIIQGFLASSGVPPSQLTIEITESVIMADPNHAMEMLIQLTNIGIRLSIDDFGTGYSSLAYLCHLRAHELKIDKSFIMDLDTNDGNNFIVHSVIELGHNLGLEVVAEGVESLATLDILGTLNCDRVQGYHLTRPQNSTDITNWLQSRKVRQAEPTFLAIDA